MLLTIWDFISNFAGCTSVGGTISNHLIICRAAELFAQISRVDSVVLADVQRLQLDHEDKLKASDGSAKGDCSCVNDKERDYRKFHGSTSSARDVSRVMASTSTGKLKQSAEIDPQPSGQIQGQFV